MQSTESSPSVESNDLSSFSVTVRIPYTADIPLCVSPQTTVADLVEIALANAAPSVHLNTPQAILYAGRVLEDNVSLTEAGIPSEGAVLHLMPRTARPEHPTGPQGPQAPHQQFHQFHIHAHHQNMDGHQNLHNPHHLHNLHHHVFPFDHAHVHAQFHAHVLDHDHGNDHHRGQHGHVHHHGHPGHVHHYGHHGHVRHHGHPGNVHHHGHHGHVHHHGHHDHVRHHGHNHGQRQAPIHHHSPGHSHHQNENDSNENNHGNEQHVNIDDSQRSDQTNYQEGNPGERSDHQTGGHIHANVVIGRLATDGHINFEDARSVLSHVLQAIGFSPSAVSAAASVAAAVALSLDAVHTSPEAAGRLFQTAWSSVLSARPSSLPQPSLPPSISHLISNPTTPERRQEPAADDATPRTTSAPSREELVQALDVLVPALAPALYYAAQAVESSVPSQHMGQNENSVDNINGSETTLLPLVSTLSSTAAALTNVISFFSSIVTARESLRERPNSENPNDGLQIPSQDVDTSDQSGPVCSALSRGVEETASPAGEPPLGAEGDQGVLATNLTDQNSADRNDAPGCIPSLSNEDRGPEAEVVTDATQLPNDRANDQVSTALDEEYSVDRTDSHDVVMGTVMDPVVSSQARNADFVLRATTMYKNAIVGLPVHNSTEGSREREQNGVEVLDHLYDGGRCQNPANNFLQFLHKMMENLSSSDIYSMLVGDLMGVAVKRGCIRKLVFDSILQTRDNFGNGQGPLIEQKRVFVDVVCEHVSDFVHVIEGVIRGGVCGSLSIPENFRRTVMDEVHSATSAFIDVLTEDTSDDEFSCKMPVFITRATVSVLCLIARELSIEWEGLMKVFRNSLASLSTKLFGMQMAALLPLLWNMIIIRTKDLFEETFSKFDWRRASCSNSQALPVQNGVCSPSEPYAVTGSTPQSTLPLCQPDHTQSDPSSNSVSDAQQTPVLDIVMNGNASYLNHEQDNIALDEEELDDLAAELFSEFKAASSEGKTTLSQLDQLAQELESDVLHERQNSHQQSNAASMSSAPLRIGPAARAMRFGIPTGGISRIGQSSGRASNELSFSPSVVASRSNPGSGHDEFDEVFNQVDAKIWRRVVSDDASSMSSAPSHGPLSRAYRFNKAPVSPLDTRHATSVAVESARAAARAARLSDEATRLLIQVAEDSGEEYLRELEGAIASRLASDDDFDSDRFPEAQQRFMSE